MPSCRELTARRGHPGQALSSLLDAAYAASTDPDRWTDLIDRISYWLGGQCFLYLRPPHDAARTRLLAANLDPAFVANHNAYYNTINSLVLSRPESRAGALPVMTVEQAVPQEELQRGEFFADWMRPQDFQHGVRIQIAPPGQQGLMLGVLRSSRIGMVTDDEAELMRGLAPHLQRVVEIASRLGSLEAKADVSLRALERLALGVVIVDAHCRVRYLNTRAEQLARARDGICVKSGRLSLPTGSDSDMQLRQGVAAATGDGRPDAARAGTTLRLRSPEPISLSISPLPQGDAVLGADALALILISRTGEHLLPKEAALREAFGLTPAEARLAAALAAGETLQIYAQNSELSMTTVKTHLRRVLEKTGEDRQSGLMRLMMSDPLLRL